MRVVYRFLDHFYDHLRSKVGIDDIINSLEYLALVVALSLVQTGLVAAQGDAVDDDHAHGGSLNPADKEFANGRIVHENVSRAQCYSDAVSPQGIV